MAVLFYFCNEVSRNLSSENTSLWVRSKLSCGGRDYFFQNVLLNRTRTVNISRRPTIIRMDRNILAKSCRLAKLSIGPISPKPGPTLLILEITALQAVAMSRVNSDMIRLEIAKMNMYKIKKPITPVIILG